MKELLLPRPYLSWSQVDLFDKNPKEYQRIYFLGGEKRSDNPYLKKGKALSEALVVPEATGDTLLDFTASSLIRYPKSEYELSMPFKSPYGEFKIMGILDTFQEKPLAFREYKTGHIAWTQKRADSHGQLKHYSSLLWLKYRGVAKVWLDWAETDLGKESDSAQFTGLIKSFPVKIELPDILDYLAWLSKKAKQISDLYRQELGL